MARTPQPLVLAWLLALTLASCSKEPDPAPPAESTPAAAPSAPVSPPAAAAADGASGTVELAPPPLGFNCDGGHRVDIAPLAANVRLADGRTAQLPRDPENAFNFKGPAMQFRMRGTSGELTQAEGIRSDCKAG